MTLGQLGVLEGGIEFSRASRLELIDFDLSLPTAQA